MPMLICVVHKTVSSTTNYSLGVGKHTLFCFRFFFFSRIIIHIVFGVMHLLNSCCYAEYMAQLLSFTVTKEIAVATDISSAYFKFFFNWVVQENMASRRYIETFKISSFVVAMGPTEHIFRSGTHPQQFEGHVRWCRHIKPASSFCLC